MSALRNADKHSLNADNLSILCIKHNRNIYKTGGLWSSMSKCRNIKHQINHAITENCRIGHSKRAENGINSGYIYSVQYAKNLRDTTENFSNFLRAVHPEIKWVRDIKSEHIQEWVDKRSSNWSHATAVNHISRMGIIKKQLNRTYKLDLDWNIELPVKDDIEKVRNKAMNKEDYLKLQELLDKRAGVAKTAVAISSRTGLRIKEIARLKAEHINTDKWVVEVRDGAKNGKYRDVSIRPSDRKFFVELRDNLSDGEYVCRGVNENSINKGIRRAMISLGIDSKYHMTTNHAIRKMYARESYQQLLDKGLSKEFAWSEVQKNLGHGAKFRQSLFDAYIGN